MYVEIPNEEKHAASNNETQQCANTECGVTLAFPIGAAAVQVRLFEIQGARTRVTLKMQQTCAVCLVPAMSDNHKNGSAKDQVQVCPVSFYDGVSARH